MKNKHVVMMVLVTIISCFYKPFYYRHDYTKETNRYLKKHNLYPTLFQTPYPEMDSFASSNTPLLQLPFYLHSAHPFSLTHQVLPTLLLKYESDTVIKILKQKEKDILIYTNLPPIDNLISWLLLENYQIQYLPRYRLYQKQHPSLSQTDILTHIHNEKDLQMTKNYADFYQNIRPAYQRETYDVLVNKQHFLPQNYVPQDLIDQLRKDCYIAMQALVSEATHHGYAFTAHSRYRSYHYQNNLYQYYLQHYTQEETDSFSCRPGFSEHQTGLAIDFAQTHHAITEIENYHGYPWFKENAHRYGFILRYPKEKDMLTGIHYEPWHFRYVGIELASLLYKMEWTLEEYHELYRQ